MRQQEGRKIVDREPELIAISTQFAPGKVEFSSSNTCVVDQQIEAGMPSLQDFCEPAYLCQRSEIREIGFHMCVSRLFQDLLPGGFQPSQITAVKEYGCTLPSQGKRCLFS